MEIVAAVALLTPLVLFFLLTVAVTVHFFWLAHQRRWPPDLAAPAVGPPPRSPGPARAGGRRPART